MNIEPAPGSRCRSTRTIAHPRGILPRAAEGTVLSTRENLGRRLYTVDFGSGAKLILFEHEIEIVDDECSDALPAMVA
jgi:hypothetical protein